MGEAVRIWRTGAEQILNYMSVYSRCEVPRIVAKDGREVVTLGDTEVQPDLTRKEDQERARVDKKNKKLDRLKDLLEWGKIDEGAAEANAEDEEETEDAEDDDIMDILSEGDESIIETLIDVLGMDMAEKKRKGKKKQSSLDTWLQRVDEGNNPELISISGSFL